MTSFFHELGEQVGRAWARVGRDERAFAAIATDALTRARPAAHVSVAALFDRFLDPDHTPLQPPMSPFGQPPLRVYEGHRFRIEALVWVESTTSIHQHSFAGAFTVLDGASFHSTYAFHEARRVNARLRFGGLAARTSEILRPGLVRPIEPGDALIHQVTHLDAPTVSLVVRTEGMTAYQPQLRYELPGVAIDADGLDPTLARRAALIGVLATTRRDAAIDAARRWIASDDLESIFHLTTQLAPFLTDAAQAELDGALVDRHGDVGASIAEACRHRRRVHVAVQLRGRTRDPALRLLAATLMLRMPRERVGALLGALAGRDGGLDDRLVELLHAGFPDVTDEDVSGDLVRALVRGATPATLTDVLAADYEPAELGAQRDALLGQAHELARLPLIDHLFTDQGWGVAAPAHHGSARS